VFYFTCNHGIIRAYTHVNGRLWLRRCLVWRRRYCKRSTWQMDKVHGHSVPVTFILWYRLPRNEFCKFLWLSRWEIYCVQWQWLVLWDVKNSIRDTKSISGVGCSYRCHNPLSCFNALTDHRTRDHQYFTFSWQNIENVFTVYRKAKITLCLKKRHWCSTL